MRDGIPENAQAPNGSCDLPARPSASSRSCCDRPLIAAIDGHRLHPHSCITRALDRRYTVDPSEFHWPFATGRARPPGRPDGTSTDKCGADDIGETSIGFDVKLWCILGARRESPGAGHRELTPRGPVTASRRSAGPSRVIRCLPSYTSPDSRERRREAKAH